MEPYKGNWKTNPISEYYGLEDWRTLQRELKEITLAIADALQYLEPYKGNWKLNLDTTL